MSMLSGRGCIDGPVLAIYILNIFNIPAKLLTIAQSGLEVIDGEHANRVVHIFAHQKLTQRCAAQRSAGCEFRVAVEAVRLPP